MDTIANIIGEELTNQYADRLTENGYALRLSPEAAAYFGVKYEECYLVFTYNNHFPEVTPMFAKFVMEK